MDIIKTIKTYFDSFLELIYPEYCVACNTNLNNNEKVLCVKCLYNLPTTNYHKMSSNPMEKALWGRVDIEKAVALFYFQKGSKYQQLIHKLKYKNRKDIGIEMGRIYGNTLIKDGVFKDISYIIPVPLFIKKKHKRGFNQSEMIAQGLAEYLPAQLRCDFLVRKKATQTQTRKSRYERWENIQGVFDANHTTELENSHILLVDDVFTTGATIEGCINALCDIKGIKISVATLAYSGGN